VTVEQTAALAEYVADLPRTGLFSVWFGPVSGPAVTAYEADQQHYAASTMKLALVIAAFRQAEARRLDLDAAVPVHNTFASRADGSPFGLDRDEDSDPEPWRRMGAPVALRWLCYRAIVKSSNLATNLVLDEVGTEPVAEALTAVGADHSVVSRGIEDTLAREAGLQNVVTAADLARTLQALYTGSAASPASCRELLSVLAAQQINDAIPAGLPAGTRIAHKSGWIEGISHDAAIVCPGPGDGGEPFVFVMCTTSELDEQAGLDLIAAGAGAAWADRRLVS
jgi:beta-lactamase class A